MATRISQSQLDKFISPEAAMAPYKRADEQKLHAQDANAKLTELLTGKSADQENEMAKLSRQQEISNASAQQAQDYVATNAMPGRHVSATFSPQGASITSNDAVDPLVKAQVGNEKLDLSAGKKAVDIYNHTAPKLQEQHTKLQEGLSAINDPHQIGSAGAAKSYLISGAAGMARYNQAEGADLVPSSVLNKISNFANSLGDDANPLTPQQRQSASALMMEALSSLQARHAMLRANAEQAYSISSPSPNPGRAAQIHSLGSDFDKSMGDTTKKYTPTIAPEQPPMPAGQGGMMDRLKAFLTGSKAQAPASGGLPSADAIQAELRRRQGGR